MAGKNKMRPEKSMAVYVYMGVFLFIILFSFGCYFAYLMLDYQNINDTESLSMMDYINILRMLTAPVGSVPITFGLILTILKMQVTKLWWLYAAGALCVFMAATSNTNDDYKGMEQGSARWANKYERKLFRDQTGIPIGKDLYVTITNPDHKSYSSHNLNEFVIGGSGAGKSFRKIIPDILQMYGSYVVTDPKGELYRYTAKVLAENGYKIRVLNLADINYSNAYNPFAYMVTEQDCISIANLFMANSAGEGEKADFWASAAEDLLVAIMVYLFKTEGETKSFGRVIRLVNSIRYKGGKIDQKSEIARCFNRHQIEHPDDVVSVNWNSIQGTPEETLGSIAKTLSTRLRLWATNDVDQITDADEMDFDHIGTEKTAIFLIIPAARQTYKTVANIFYSQLFERLMYIANRDHHGSLPLLVSCEMDEFANIGKIPAFSETLAVVRSYNIRICIVVQGISLLKENYEKSLKGIMGNCSIKTFLGTDDEDSKEYIVKKLGKTTVRVASRSYNRGQQGGGSDSESFIARDLLGVDEIEKVLASKGAAKRYGGKCIAFVDEHYPLMEFKFDTPKHSLFSKLGSSSKFPAGMVNNTDITETYAAVKAEREAAYRKKMEEARARDLMWEQMDEQRAQQAEAAEQAGLAAEFGVSQPVTNEAVPYVAQTTDDPNEVDLAAEMEDALAAIPSEDISQEKFEMAFEDEDAYDEDF